ncbi:TRM6 [Candida oxycetoniae]|uniref:tRNA (adenine(58)-N(1))-methyltransferase non-catalytic subunit TRM6 n=1 Tax=Candida oxycetoniae TaxID=497107 RepID=A0AAI9SZ97_9ASCO|nr:TRM6 [Candida oxycetoniae]KAI3405983.1 TRM6 [Candida oxycetoniae]
MAAVKKNDSTIEAGQHVIIRLPSNGLKIVLLQESGLIGLGKFGTFEVSHILGYPLGSSFEIIEDNKAVPIKCISEQAELNVFADKDRDAQKQELTKIFNNSAENNQNIVDIGAKIQSLSKKDIDELKKSGASSNVGQMIIEKIVQGHEGFDKKTVFSQQKYVKRKQQKFLRRFSVDYLSASQLLEYYIEKDANRVLNLSIESLGLLMSYGNVRPGGKYLVIDETGGILVYAMMERMNNEGSIILLHENEHSNLIALTYSDYGDEVIDKIVKPINWLQFAEPENEKIKFEEVDAKDIKKSKAREQHNKRRERAQKINDIIDAAQEGNFDGFISMSTLYMPEALEFIIPKIGGSKPIVIYNQCKEPLAEVQANFTSDKRILASSIFETRVRPYQTIPGRIHPTMTMRSGGGYVLWGTRVIPNVAIIAVGKGMKRKREREEEEGESVEFVSENSVTPDMAADK